jgi:hypothetical protein
VSNPLLDVVIACHDESRPVERAVGSVLQDAAARESVRVTVVAHGIPAAPLEERLAGISGSVRVEAFDDGIRSAAGPFNRGLDLATADYVMVMGSDDFLEPGAMDSWLSHVRRESPSAAIVRIRIQGEPIMPNPLPRLGRARRLDAAKDRLFYRTAPLALVARSEAERLGLRMVEGVRVGEDFEYGIRLWSLGERIDLLSASPCYVIGTDARERTTHAPLSLEEAFAPIIRLLDDGLPAQLRPTHRRALAIKLVRTSVIGWARSRPRAEAWSGDDEVAALAAILRRILSLAPHVLTPFNRQDRAILDGLLATPTVARMVADVDRAARAGRRDRWLTVNPLHSFDRESMLRRYVLYFLGRERSASRS